VSRLLPLARAARPPPLPLPDDGLLRDAQGRRITYLRLSVTDTCNFRCAYCSPANWAGRAALLRADELVRLATVFAKAGVSRVRLTGGEPLVRDDLPEIARGIASIPGIGEVCLTTNGHRLAELATPLRAAGVSVVNVSLDTLDPAGFRTLTKTGDLARVVAGVLAAGNAGFSRLGLNAVLLSGVNDDAASIASLVRFAWSHGAVPRFIELMPFAGDGAPVPSAEVVKRLESRGFSLVPRERRAGAGPARYWDADDGSAARGEIGFIGAMTENFCASCNRVRVSATGEVRSCLGGHDQVPLGALLRGGASDAALLSAIQGALGAKREGHRFVEDGRAGLLPMMGIGG
jgi:cyclic pyranopterin phosphate synthase